MLRLLVPALLLALSAPAPARAAVVSYENGTLRIVAAAGETAGPEFSYSGAEAPRYLVNGRGAPLQAGTGCELDWMRNAICAARDDRAFLHLDFSAAGAHMIEQDEAFPYSGSLVLGGPASDALVVGNAPDEMHGGDGRDRIDGLGGNDRLHGDAGDDSFVAGPGDDLYDGGDGLDLVQYDPPDPFDPVVGYRVSLDGLANDGPAGETDQLVGIEQVMTGDAADTITGSDADERLYAGGGRDTIRAGAGDDQIYPNAGKIVYDQGRFVRGPQVESDDVQAGPGDDLIGDIELRGMEEVPELVDRISCGSGRDTVLTRVPAARALRRLTRGCEIACRNVNLLCRERGVAPVRIVSSRAAGSRVELLCPRARPRGCRGQVDLREGPRLLGSAPFSLRRGRTGRLRLPAGANASAQLVLYEGPVIMAVRRAR